jgi:hypothetical protein
MAGVLIRCGLGQRRRVRRSGRRSKNNKVGGQAARQIDRRVRFQGLGSCSGLGLADFFDFLRGLVSERFAVARIRRKPADVRLGQWLVPLLPRSNRLLAPRGPAPSRALVDKSLAVRRCDDQP